MRAWAVFTAAAALALTGCGGGTPPAETKKAEPPAQPPGVISGKAAYSGAKPVVKRIRMDEEAACVRMHKGGLNEEDLAVNADGSLTNVFVYIQSGLEGRTFPPATEPATIDQKGCRFEPHVLGIRTGQTLKVLNSDPVSHNIHPVPAANREWNQGQAPGAQALEREFARPEIMVPVKCNVHSWMKAYIGVVEHPYFAVTGADGTFSLKDVPPGEYTLEAWHEKLPKQQQKVTVTPSGTVAVEFQFQ